jgi:hypothetical protein
MARADATVSAGSCIHGLVVRSCFRADGADFKDGSFFFLFGFLAGYYYYRYHGGISEGEAECKNGVRGRGSWGTGTQGGHGKCEREL